MKKIFLAIFIVFLLLSGVSVFAESGTGNGNDSSETEKNPSITIEFNDMDELSNEFQELQKDFDGKKIEIDHEGSVALGVFALLGVGMIIFLIALGIFCFVFWIIMLIHAIKHPIKSKALWILILLLFGILGAIVYYFAVKKPFHKKSEVVQAEKTNTNN